MVRDAVVFEVQLIIGRRSDLISEIVSALQYAQDEREKPGITYPWWLEKSTTLPTTPGTDFVNIPSDFIQEREEQELSFFYRPPGTRRFLPLEKKNFRIAVQAFQEAEGTPPITGLPQFYSEAATVFALTPVPDAVYNLKLFYWGRDTVLSTNIENGWLKNAPWVLIGDAAMKVGASLQNASAVSQAQAILARAESNLFRSVIHRKEAGIRGRRMGSRL